MSLDKLEERIKELEDKADDTSALQHEQSWQIKSLEESRAFNSKVWQYFLLAIGLGTVKVVLDNAGIKIL